jgi:hypothetical protein
VTRHPAQDEEVGQDVDYVDRLELAIDADRQAFVSKLVDDVEHAVLPSLVGAVLNEVVGPDVIGMLRPQPDARSIGEPQPPAFGLLLRDLQPLTSPDPLDPRVADEPAGITQQRGDLAVAIATVLPGQFDYVGCQPFGIFTAPRDLALRRAMLPERRTSAALGDMQAISDMLNAGSATRGA